MTRMQKAVDVLIKANPVTEEESSRWVGSNQARNILSGILQSEPSEIESLEQLREGRGSPRAGKPKWLPAVAGVFSIVLVVSLVLRIGPIGPQPQATEREGTLNQIALVASQQTSLEVPPGSYRYSNVQRTGTQTFGGKYPYSVLVSGSTEYWIKADGTGRILSQAQSFDFPTDEDRLAWEQSGRPQLVKSNPSDREIKFGEGPPAAVYDDLPTAPGDLYNAIKQRAGTAGPGQDAEMFILIGDLLRPMQASPELRASLLTVAGMIPGVKVTEGVKDPIARSAVSVSLTYDDSIRGVVRVERLFDPKTSMLLAESEIVQRSRPAEVSTPKPPGVPSDPRVSRLPRPPIADSGTLIGEVIYRSQGVVGSIDQRP